MSHIVSISVEMTDLIAVKAACKRLGWEFKEGQSTYAWYGRSVGDYPLPAGMTKDDLGKCNHAVGVPGASYEVGLRKHGNNWVPVWDFWCSGGLKEDTGKRFAAAYAAEKAKIEARKKGYRVASETIKEDGTIRLTLTHN